MKNLRILCDSVVNPSFAFTVEPTPPRLVARARRAPVPSVQALAERMLYELIGNELSVCLVPDRLYDGVGNDFRRLRAAETQNAAWYREFCGRYESRRSHRGRKFKTLIKRRETIRALERVRASSTLPNGRASAATPYEIRLLSFINRLRTNPEFLQRMQLTTRL